MLEGRPQVASTAAAPEETSLGAFSSRAAIPSIAGLQPYRELGEEPVYSGSNVSLVFRLQIKVLRPKKIKK